MEDGRKIKKEIEEIALIYFKKLFTSSHPNKIQDALSWLKACVDDEMNGFLTMPPFTPLDIKVALFHIGPTKTLGPNRFPALFYQKHWDVVGRTSLR